MKKNNKILYQWVAKPPTFFSTKETCLAIDTEFVWRTTYRPIPAVIQIKSQAAVYLIDAIAVDEWQWLKNLFVGQTQFVMHAAEGDLEIFHQLCQTIPRHIFDTQVAAAYVGMGRSLSLKALVKQILGKDLSKTQSTSDWLQRPLSEAQKGYAAKDVLYLIDIKEVLSQKLRERHLDTFFYEDMRLMADWQPMEPRNAYRQVKGAWMLGDDIEAWSVLARLAEWRERTAGQLNCPKRRIVTDAALVWLSQHRPLTEKGLKGCTALTEVQCRRHGAKLLALINSRGHSQDIRPIRRLIDIPEGSKLLKEMKLRAAEAAKSCGVPDEVLYNNRLLTGLIQWKFGMRESPPKQWFGWRGRLLKEYFAALEIPEIPSSSV